MSDEAIWGIIETERNRLADDLEQLTDEQWATSSQCEAWTVEEVAKHLILPFEVSLPRLAWTVAKRRGDLNRAFIDLTAWIHGRVDRDEAIARLRANAASRWTPPRLGPEIPLSEVVVHGQDIRRSIGMEHGIPAETIELALTGISDPEMRADYARRIGVEAPAG